ncbi:MAG: hypothetical protein ACQESH_05105 [Campylobacterota bacterium]
MYYTQPIFWFWMIVYAIVLTYIVWAVAFAFQALLLLNDVESAKSWVRKWYSRKSFLRELEIFAPVILLFYYLLEYIPSLFFKERTTPFNKEAIWEVAQRVLIKE